MQEESKTQIQDKKSTTILIAYLVDMVLIL